MTSLDWNSFVMAKNVSVASVGERGVPCVYACDMVCVCVCMCVCDIVYIHG